MTKMCGPTGAGMSYLTVHPLTVCNSVQKKTTKGHQPRNEPSTNNKITEDVVTLTYSQKERKERKSGTTRQRIIERIFLWGEQRRVFLLIANEYIQSTRPTSTYILAVEWEWDSTEKEWENGDTPPLPKNQTETREAERQKEKRILTLNLLSPPNYCTHIYSITYILLFEYCHCSVVLYSLARPLNSSIVNVISPSLSPNK